MTDKKRFSLVLHSHLPYVLNHGTWPHGSDWLSEVAAETYLPILRMIGNLQADGIIPGLTIGLTPILCEQLASDKFKSEFQKFISTRISAAEKDLSEFGSSSQDKELIPLAEMWISVYRETLDQFNEINQDIVGAFRKHADAGVIEIIGSAATHGFLPLLHSDVRVREQIATGVRTYEKHFGAKPAGFWLPECAYRPSGHWRRPGENAGEVDRSGLEDILGEEGVRYFIVDSHLVTHGTPLGSYKRLLDPDHDPVISDERTSGAPTHRAYMVSDSPVACYVRDAACGMQVWSGEHGYPGDPSYLEFHKRRWPGGMRYWSVTGPGKDLGDKVPYNQAIVHEKATAQAWHFVGMLKWVLREGGIVCAPYDAELFGHWWHEGVFWMEEVFRLLAADPDIDSVTLSTDLKENPPDAKVGLPEGSWGAGGGFDVWLNPDTLWIWELIYPLSERLESVSNRLSSGTDEYTDKLLGNARRQMLLSEASDWPFLIHTGNVRDYAELRVKEHTEALNRILDELESIASGDAQKGNLQAWLQELEERDFPFAGLL